MPQRERRGAECGYEWILTSPIFEPAISQNFGTIFVFSRRSRYSLSTYESPASTHGVLMQHLRVTGQ